MASPWAVPTTVGLLVLSNVFMTFAWYGHLKTSREPVVRGRPGRAGAWRSFEYLLQVPANRIGYARFSLGAAEDPAGGDHAGRLRAVRSALHGPAAEARLPVGGAVPLGAVYFVFRA